MIAELHPIDVLAMTTQDAEELWQRIRKQKLCFDDFTRDRGDVFASRLVNPTSAAFETKDGLVLVESIVPRLSAEIHFYLWGSPHEVDIDATGRDILWYVFHTYKVHRISAYPPVFNKIAKRLAARLGFKYEGCIRQQFLYEGRYQDVLVYGLLEQEFVALGGK